MAKCFCNFNGYDVKDAFARKAIVFATPEQFGAVGDGVTDDTIAIQRAIDTGMIVCGDAEKLYYCADSLSGKNSIYNLNLKMEQKKLLYFEHKNDIVLKDCYFETDVITESRGEWLVCFEYCDGALIEHCSFKNAQAHLIINASKNAKVRNCHFFNAPQVTVGGVIGYGVCLQCCTNTEIDGNTFEDVARHSVYISGASAYETEHEICIDTKVTNNTFVMNNPDLVGYNDTGFEQQVKLMGAKNTIVANNYFENVVGGVLLSRFEIEDGATTTSHVENAIIEGNIFKNCNNPKRKESGAGAIYSVSIRNNPNFENVTIAKNIFVQDNGGINNAIKVVCGKRLIIADNICVNNTSEYFALASFKTEEGGADAEAHLLSEVTIRNNKVSNAQILWMNSIPAECLGAVKHIHILNNECITSGNIYSVIQTMFTAGSMTDITIEGNYISGCSKCVYILGDDDKQHGIVLFNNNMNNTQAEILSAEYSEPIHCAFNRGLNMYHNYSEGVIVESW